MLIKNRGSDKMAAIGSSLTSPEIGWRRYDDQDSRIKYIGTGWNLGTYTTGTAFYNRTAMYGLDSNDIISFKFYGE
jgi:hypothetical protein